MTSVPIMRFPDSSVFDPLQRLCIVAAWHRAQVAAIVFGGLSNGQGEETS